jgi:hypothetical protein
MPCRACAMPRLCRSERDFSRPRRGMGIAWHWWISIGRPETACGRPACVRLLLATTWSYTMGVIRSIPIRETVGLALRIFPATTRPFTKDTALSENGRGAAWHGWGTVWARHGVWISLKALNCTFGQRLGAPSAYRISVCQNKRGQWAHCLHTLFVSGYIPKNL